MTHPNYLRKSNSKFAVMNTGTGNYWAFFYSKARADLYAGECNIKFDRKKFSVVPV